MKKGDFAVAFLIVILLLICLFPSGEGKSVAIYVDGELYERLPLYENTKVLVKSEFGKNTVVIENGGVYVKESDCPNKQCEKEIIKETFRSIICLPNRLSIIIEGEKNDDGTDVII